MVEKKIKVKNCLIVTQIGSGIGGTPIQRRNLIGLGLGRLNKSRVLEDTPAIRGMINKVKHLVIFENAQ